MSVVTQRCWEKLSCPHDSAGRGPGSSHSGPRGCCLGNQGAMRVRPWAEPGQKLDLSPPPPQPCRALQRRRTVTGRPPGPWLRKIGHLALASRWKTNTTKIWACSSGSTTYVLLETPRREVKKIFQGQKVEGTQVSLHEGWTNTMWSIQTMEQYSALKRTETLTHATTCDCSASHTPRPNPA